MTDKTCIDCAAAGRPLSRVADNPGPRCATDWRIELKRRSRAAHARRVASVYGLPVGMYEALYEAQGGRCAICRWATGKTKRLAVDHDHAAMCCPPGPTSCGRCVRGLLCGPCNQTIGRLGSEALSRAVEYLADPPARYILDRKVGH